MIKLIYLKFIYSTTYNKCIIIPNALFLTLFLTPLLSHSIILNLHSMQKDQPKTNTHKPEPIGSVTQVFSKSRDIDADSPYHLDGNLEMYNE